MIKRRFLQLGIIITTFGLVSPLLAAEKTSAPFTPAQTKAIEDTIHRYLLDNPEILIEVGQKLQQKEQKQFQQMQQQTVNTIPLVAKQLVASKGDPVVGNPSAPVTLVEFFDYRCPHCKEMRDTMDGLIAANPKNLRIVFKEFPIFGGTSLYAAKAALAADKQGKYLAFHNALLTQPNPMSNEDVINLAKNAGLNVDTLKKDMENPGIDAVIQANFAMAKQLNVFGTPAFIVIPTNVENIKDNAKKISYFPGVVPGEALQSAINQAAS